MNEQLASIQITPLTQIFLPDEGPASACIIQFPKSRILLTVYHAAGDGRNWFAAVRYFPGQGMQHYPLGGMNILKRFSIGKRKLKSKQVDFAYVTVPDSLEPMDEVLDEGGNIISSFPKQILPAKLAEPNANHNYSFFGLTRHRIDDKFNLVMTPKLESGLVYVGGKDDLLRFRCKERYHEYEEYQGCSGAPILNENGEIVSLVVEGSDDRWEILGLNLKYYWAALLIEAGEFAK